MQNTYGSNFIKHLYNNRYSYDGSNFLVTHVIYIHLMELFFICCHTYEHSLLVHVWQCFLNKQALALGIMYVLRNKIMCLPSAAFLWGEVTGTMVEGHRRSLDTSENHTWLIFFKETECSIYLNMKQSWMIW